MKLELSIEEINYVLSVLADRPYRESAGIIEKIKSQEPKNSEENAE